MTTRARARIYRAAPKPLAPGACPQCSRVISLTRSGKRRMHRDRSGHRCPGSNIHVGDWTPVRLAELPPVVIKPRSLIKTPDPRVCVCGQRPRRKRDGPDPRVCVCGQRPRRKRDGRFAAHRVDVDNPATPYCPNGATRSR